MGRKTLFWMFVAVCAAFIAGALAFPAENGSRNAPGAAGDYLPMQIVATKNSPNPLYRVSLEYPQFPSAPASFNESIRSMVQSKLAQFEESAKDNWKARQDTTPAGEPKPVLPSPTPYFFSATWEPKQLNAQTVSFVVRFESFEGGANERQELATFNYDFAAKKTITLADLFPGTPDYLQKISKFAQDQLLGSLDAQNSGGPIMTDMILSGTAPTAENFSNFVFNDDAVEFYFPKYQVAPGVYGEQHVIMSRRSL